MSSVKTIVINLSHIASNLSLTIDAKVENTLFDCDDAMLNGEARYQLKEGCTYDYEFSSRDYSFAKADYIQPHGRLKHIGVIAPNIYVGSLLFKIEGECFRDCKAEIKLEVRSVKSDYRTDYRTMLENITEKCTELVMQIDSPVSQQIVTTFDVDNKTLYQRFSFVKSVIDSSEFEEAIQKIISNPTTKWQTETDEKDIRNIRKFGQKDIQQLVARTNRIALPSSHFLHERYGIRSVPNRIESMRKTESIDTPENRFVKYALQEFLFFTESCQHKFENFTRSQTEARLISEKISAMLNQSFFKKINRPDSLKLNSPVLQRKSGYRELLNAWLKYDLAAKLIWEGGDNVYEAGKKDIARLYEYWIFFELLDLLKEIFNIEPKSIEQLIRFDKDRIALNLKQGKTVALKGIYESAWRKLNVQFCYNRSFGGGRKYPDGGSYTTTLRPDYTLSVWPAEIDNQSVAEKMEMITHIHFDAKYKVSNFYDLVTSSKGDELDEVENEELLKEEEEEDVKGTFKNQDLLKMHAYKDAIRRTGGAYVLYPGEGNKEPFRGFHELIPGLGAFVIRPQKSEKEKEQLKDFIIKVVNNFNDRASQREHTAVKVYDIHKNTKRDHEILNAPIPEFIGDKKLIPDETFILVGYCKDSANINWYKNTGIYNFRMDDDKGSLSLENNVVNAQYLLIRESGKDTANKFFKIISKGPKVMQGKLLPNGYKTNKLKDYYLVIEIEKEESIDFNGASFNFKELEKFKEIKATTNNPYKAPAIPFAVSLSELYQVLKQ